MGCEAVDLVPVPSKKSHEVPTVCVSLGRCQMNHTEPMLDGGPGLVVPGADMPIIGDDDPAPTGYDRYPVRVVSWDEYSHRIMTTDYHVGAQLHHGQPEPGKVLIYEESDLLQGSQSGAPVHAIAACTWS